MGRDQERGIDGFCDQEPLFQWKMIVRAHQFHLRCKVASVIAERDVAHDLYGVIGGDGFGEVAQFAAKIADGIRVAVILGIQTGEDRRKDRFANGIKDGDKIGNGRTGLSRFPAPPCVVIDFYNACDCRLGQIVSDPHVMQHLRDTDPQIIRFSHLYHLGDIYLIISVEYVEIRLECDIRKCYYNNNYSRLTAFAWVVAFSDEVITRVEDFVGFIHLIDR